MNEMKPCPFCAYKAVEIKKWPSFDSAWTFAQYAVGCPNCKAIGPSDPNKSYAIKAWNMRPAANGNGNGKEEGE
jgi:Lar family restriction alleviation protein